MALNQILLLTYFLLLCWICCL